MEYFVGLGGDFGAVGHDNHAFVLVMGQILENRHNVVLRGQIEIAGRFVGDFPLRSIDGRTAGKAVQDKFAR